MHYPMGERDNRYLRNGRDISRPYKPKIENNRLRAINELSLRIKTLTISVLFVVNWMRELAPES